MMTNIRKAAILLEAVGEPHTTRILNQLSANDSLRVLQEMTGLESTSNSEVSSVLSEVIKYKRANTYGKQGNIVK